MDKRKLAGLLAEKDKQLGTQRPMGNSGAAYHPPKLPAVDSVDEHLFKVPPHPLFSLLKKKLRPKMGY